MQKILQCSKRNILRSKTTYWSCLYQHIMIKNNDNFRRCFNHNQIHRLFGSLSHNALRQLHREYKAVNSMLVRSGLVHNRQPHEIYQSRYLSCSSSKLNNDNSRKSKDSSNSNKDSNKKDDAREKEHLRVKAFTAWTLVAYVFVIFSILLSNSSTSTKVEKAVPSHVSWNEFVYQMLAKGEVKKVIIVPDRDIVEIELHDGAIVNGKKSVHKYYNINLPNISKLEEKIREAEKNLGIKPEFGVPVEYVRNYEGTFTLILLCLLVGAVLASRVMNSNPKISSNMFSQMTNAKFTLVDPLTGIGKGIRFSDVAGLQEAKTEVMEFVDYLKNPHRYKTLGAKVPKGALLLGPPGCGKTLLAKAVATEANVPFLSMNGSEFMEMIGGLGAARVRDLFNEGKKRAPSIIYIDEIDAIGQHRSDSNMDRGNSEREQTLNQLLTEMDGMVTNQEVIVMASTNRAEVLDNALLRPGRFDRHILIDLPTASERRHIFEQHLKGLTLERKPSTYSSRLSFLTPGFSGADIANVCNEAALHAARKSKVQVTGDDLLYAVDRLIAGVEKRDNTIAPSEKRVVAYHEAGHALVGWLLEHTDALLKVSIVPRTNRALGFAQFTPSDQKLYTREQLFERMCMSLGGRVAESLTFNRITTGAQNDLDKVTKIAYAQVQQYGMDKAVGLLSFLPEQTDTKTRKPYSRKLGNLMDKEARMIVAEVYKRTEQLLIENEDKLKLLAEALLEKETLTYEEVEKLLGPPPFGKKNLIEPEDFEKSVPIPSPSEPKSPSPQPTASA